MTEKNTQNAINGYLNLKPFIELREKQPVLEPNYSAFQQHSVTFATCAK